MKVKFFTHSKRCGKSDRNVLINFLEKMSSKKNTVDFILEQIEEAGSVFAKKMFGEYGIYCNERIVAFVCDDQLFVKPTTSGRAFIDDVVEGFPYPGAKPYLLISDELWNNRKWLTTLFKISAAELPLPTKKFSLIKKKMKRHAFQHNGLTFSYLDSEGDGKIFIALHAHWMEASTFVPLAASLAPEWRMIALDQRGHGDSDHAATYTRDDYLDDLFALLRHLKLKEPVVLLGNSLGGVNVYQFAARHPDLVRAMIVEDIGVEIAADMNFVLTWKGIFKTREELENCVGPRFLPYLKDSFRETKEGWQLPFNPQDMLESNRCITGNYWKEWLATDCPVLLLRGKESRVTTHAHLEEISLRRPNTFFQTLEGGHVIHLDNPASFNEVVSTFLNGLKT